MQLKDHYEATNCIDEDAIPLKIQLLEEQISQDTNSLDSIQQQIIKLSTKFAVDFKGCDEKAKELLVKIDKNKQLNKRVQTVRNIREQYY